MHIIRDLTIPIPSIWLKLIPKIADTLADTDTFSNLAEIIH